MPPLNKILLPLLSLFPTAFIKKIAMRYVAGETSEEALSVVRELNNEGFSATMDILGENTRSHENAAAVKDAYIQLYEDINQEGLDCTISLKLTHLGLGYDDALAENYLLEILEQAMKRDTFLRIDMEDSPHTDTIIHLFQKCLERYPKVGVVLQSYLRRSKADLASLLGDRLNIRICKGIYHEPPDVAFHDREEIRHNFIQLVQTAMDGGAYVGIATHDHTLIDSLETWIVNKQINNDRYEFQVLYGVPMKGRLTALLASGHKVRVYIPYGEQWYLYALRRLEENPKIAGFVMKNLFMRK